MNKSTMAETPNPSVANHDGGDIDNLAAMGGMIYGGADRGRLEVWKNLEKCQKNIITF